MGEMSVSVMDRRTNKGRRAEDNMSGEDRICLLHEASERWNEERWNEQQRKNDAFTKLIESLRIEIAGIKTYIAYGVGAMAAIQLFGPTLLKLLRIDP